MISYSFPELVERARQATNEVCEKSKLVLRLLSPGVDALQNENAHFSPRLMLLMLSRTGDQLNTDDRDRFESILAQAEAFQPQLIAWMTAVQDKPGDAGSPADAKKCADALELTTNHLSNLDALLAKVDGR